MAKVVVLITFFNLLTLVNLVKVVNLDGVGGKVMEMMEEMEEIKEMEELEMEARHFPHSSVTRHTSAHTRLPQKGVFGECELISSSSLPSLVSLSSPSSLMITI